MRCPARSCTLAPVPGTLPLSQVAGDDHRPLLAEWITGVSAALDTVVMKKAAESARGTVNGRMEGDFCRGWEDTLACYPKRGIVSAVLLRLRPERELISIH